MPLPSLGDIIDFTLPDQDGTAVSVASLRGAPVVLFFYPRADTPGCTVEACGFRDAFAELHNAGVQVLGISRDTVRAQKKFAEKYALRYTLLADADQQLVQRFGLVKPKMMYGKQVTGVARTTLVLDRNGRLVRIYENVKPEGHAEQVLADLQAAA